MNYITILNYINNRSTNDYEKSSNAKIKKLGPPFRGVKYVVFFLDRLTKLIT
jgi:hypothetical protein